MANSTVLVLVQQALQELGVVGYGQPSSVIGNTSSDIVQTLALTQGFGRELSREYQWQAATIEYRFTTQYLTTTGTRTTSAATVTAIPTTAALAAGTWMATGTGIPQDTYIQSVDSATQVTLTQTPTVASSAGAITFSQTKYVMPSDYDRLVDRTDWDKTNRWENLGPQTGQQWQWLKSGYIATGPRVRYRVLGNYFQIWPPLASNDYMGFEYVSKFWILATGGTAPTKSAFTVDTDTCIFPDALMNIAIKKAYFQAKGFAPVFDEQFLVQKDLAKAHDAGSPTLSLSPRVDSALITQNNIPDGNINL